MSAWRTLIGVTTLVAAALTPWSLGAQGVRGWVGSTVQMVELRPIQALESGCIPGSPCYSELDEARSFAATQDLSLTGWGFGVRGLSVSLLLRSRARLGSDVLWPRTDDAFDALLAYAQYVRGPLSVRAGRQEIRSGLGFSSFDGGSVALGGGRFRFEGYGGRSLARGLRAPANEVLRGIEDFVPDRGVRLWGGSARLRLPRASLAVRYQREILEDRSALMSERGSLDVTAAVPGARITGSLDYDFAFERVGKGRLTLSVPISGGRWMLEASARRYVPYFSLSTIWGFFEPVEYEEARLRVGWSPSSSVGLWASGGWRRYGDAEATVVLRALEDHGRRGEAGFRWLMNGAWTFEADYRLEWGPGGFLNSADGSVRWTRSDRLSLSASATAFQQVEQYRLGDGRAVGGGLSLNAALSERISFAGGLSILRHRTEGGAVDSPWNQSRGWTSVRVLVGDDPGLANRRRP